MQPELFQQDLNFSIETLGEGQASKDNYYKGDAELYLEWAWLWGRGRCTAQRTELHLLTSSCLM